MAGTTRGIAVAMFVVGCGRIAFDPRGDAPDAPASTPRTFAYVIDGTSTSTTKTSLRVLNVADDGTLTDATTFELGAKPLALNSRVDGSRLYVTTRDDNSLYTLAIDPMTGGLSMLDRVTIGIYGNRVAVHPNGRWIYVGDWANTSRIDGFELDSNGIPAPIPGSPFSFPGIAAVWVELHPNGQWAYVLDQSTSEVHAMAISSSTGALTPLGVPSWDSLDTGAYAALIDSTGRFGFIAFDLNSAFPAFTIDTSGAMSTTPGSPFNYAGANTIQNAAMDRTRRRVFLADQGSGFDTLGAFRVDTTTGAPVPLLNSPYPTSQLMWAVATSPVTDDVYTTTAGGVPAILHFRADDTAVTKLGEYAFPGLDRASLMTLVQTQPP